MGQVMGWLIVMGTTKVTQKGQVVIPAEFRKKYGIRTPGQVEIVEKEGYLAIMPLPDDSVIGSRGMLKAKQPLSEANAAYKKQELMLEVE